MPFVPIPIQVGLGSDTNESDWIDRIPVNMLAVKKHILSEGTDYYLRSFPGLTPVPDHEAISGSPRGSVYNKGSDSVFRVFGSADRQVRLTSGRYWRLRLCGNAV